MSIYCRVSKYPGLNSSKQQPFITAQDFVGQGSGQGVLGVGGLRFPGGVQLPGGGCEVVGTSAREAGGVGSDGIVHQSASMWPQGSQTSGGHRGHPERAPWTAVDTSNLLNLARKRQNIPSAVIQ